MVAEAYDQSHRIYGRKQREVNVGAQLAFFPHLSFPRISSSLYVHHRKKTFGSLGLQQEGLSFKPSEVTITSQP